MLPILKHAKNFISAADKPIFQGINFDGKRAVVTNGAVLVIANNYPSEKKTVHYKTGAMIDGIYPDVTRCVPENCETTFDIKDLKEWIRVLKIAIAVSTDSYPSNTCRLDINAGFVVLVSTGLNSKFETDLATTLAKGNLKSISFSAKYLHDILAFFKDSDVNVVTMGFNTALSPIRLITDKDVLAVLSPVRT